MRICIDLMGGDNPPELLFPAITQAATQLSSDQSLLVIATAPVIDQLSSQLNSSLSAETRARISVQECDEVIFMEDDPLTVVRRKKRSSMIMGMELLKDHKIDALVSCGNTGALIAGAAIILPKFAGISHPALMAVLPTEKGPMAVLDVGGNVAGTSEQLVRFAALGAAYQRVVAGIEVPKVGLLNIGEEAGKGTLEVRQAYGILKEADRVSGFHFYGNVEARELFKGTVDVLVTDGFTGNILLKTAEGVASFIFESLKDKVQVGSGLNDLKGRFNYAEYPGAIVCGVDGLVVKVHGNATAASMLASIFSAIECVQKKVVFHLRASSA